MLFRVFTHLAGINELKYSELRSVSLISGKGQLSPMIYIYTFQRYNTILLEGSIHLKVIGLVAGSSQPVNTIV